MVGGASDHHPDPVTTSHLTMAETTEDAASASAVCLPTHPSRPSIDPAATGSVAGADVVEHADGTTTAGPPAHHRRRAAFTRRLIEAAGTVTPHRQRRGSPDRTRADLGSPLGSGWEMATRWTTPWC
jgi:hypothetical protein